MKQHFIGGRWTDSDSGRKQRGGLGRDAAEFITGVEFPLDGGRTL